MTRLDTSSELSPFPVHVRSIGPTVEGREEMIYKAYIGLSLTRLDTSSELSPFSVHVRSIGPTVEGREEMIYEPRHAERVLNVFFSKFSFHPISKELFILNNL